MRLVLDTNVAVSGLLWGGNSGQLIDAARVAQIEIATSVALLTELHGVRSRPRFAQQLARHGFSVADLFDGYAALASVLVPAEIPQTVLRDPVDDRVLACAIAADADLIVSGDAHLLNLKWFQGIAIVAPVEAVKRIAA